MRCFYLVLFVSTLTSLIAQNGIRKYDIIIGPHRTGEYNSITDVPGTTVGHTTIHRGDSIHTGVTAIIPHQGNIYQDKVAAAMYIGNGFGKLAGYSQVKELGNIETPIILTNTLSVPTAMDGVISYTLNQEGNHSVRSVNAVVGETNDGYLNDIRGRHIAESHVITAIKNARPGTIEQGNVGAGAGTRCFGWKGGIGTSSRVLPTSRGGYTIGVIVQTNFGGNLRLQGVPIGDSLGTSYFGKIGDEYEDDGSCMIVVATDAPVDARQLERIAKRAFLGIARSGGIASHGSGDYVIAYSTHPAMRTKVMKDITHEYIKPLADNQLTILFDMTIDATEEAILNSLFEAETLTGHRGTTEKLPIEKCLNWLNKK